MQRPFHYTPETFFHTTVEFYAVIISLTLSCIHKLRENQHFKAPLQQSQGVYPQINHSKDEVTYITGPIKSQYACKLRLLQVTAVTSVCIYMK